MNRRTVSALTFTLLTLAVVLGPAFAGGPATTRIVPASTPATIDVDLPSDSTGVPSGTLALRIHAPPSPADARYPEAHQWSSTRSAVSAPAHSEPSN